MKAALTFAKRYVGDCHAVEVISELSHEPLLGSPAPAPVAELEAEISRRRSAIEASRAQLEMLLEKGALIDSRD